MNPQIEVKLRRIEKLSAVLRTICTVLMVLTCVGGVAAVIALAIGRGGTVSYFGERIAVTDLEISGRLAVATMCVVSAAVFVTGLYQLRRLLNNYAHREIFSAASARHIRLLGYCSFAWGVMDFLWQFMPLLTRLNHPHEIMFRADSLVLGAVIIVISWCTEMGAALREESELTI